MIQKVHIQNFKCLQDVSVELERFTVFVGRERQREDERSGGDTSTRCGLRRSTHKRCSPTSGTETGFTREAAIGDLSIRCETERRRIRCRGDASRRVSASARADAERAVGVPP